MRYKSRPFKTLEEAKAFVEGLHCVDDIDVTAYDPKKRADGTWEVIYIVGDE